MAWLRVGGELPDGRRVRRGGRERRLWRFVLAEVPVQPTGTLIGLSTGTVVYGREQAERVSVKVTAHLAVPRGGLSWAGSKAVCSIPLKTGKGSCLLTAKELRPGKYHLQARYSASAPYAQSTSVLRTLVVKK